MSRFKTEPNELIYESVSRSDHYTERSRDGLTKREYFTAMALSTIDMKSIFLDGTEEIIARSAVKIADAVIKELNLTKSGET